MIFKGKNNEFIHLVQIDSSNCELLKEHLESSLTVLWITSDTTILNIDGVDYTFLKNQIVCLTEFHKVAVKSVSSINMVKFNRAFYCILHHDNEVGCKGLLFFGANQIPILKISEEDLEKFNLLWKTFEMEMDAKDDLQIEMLQIMLQRLLILTTRLHKVQNQIDSYEKGSLDLLRNFNLLVETHFKEKHTVTQYAEMLHKSPKTLANIFSKTYQKTPLQYIQDRLALEARRLLGYTDKPIKEIAYELGFDDIQSFSRFFKKKEGVSPTEFKEKAL
jgi:AraC family transcriptional regulator, transcriptional activator of pobA